MPFYKHTFFKVGTRNKLSVGEIEELEREGLAQYNSLLILPSHLINELDQVTEEGQS